MGSGAAATADVVANATSVEYVAAGAAAAADVDADLASVARLEHVAAGAARATDVDADGASVEYVAARAAATSDVVAAGACAELVVAARAAVALVVTAVVGQLALEWQLVVAVVAFVGWILGANALGADVVGRLPLRRLGWRCATTLDARASGASPVHGSARYLRNSHLWRSR